MAGFTDYWEDKILDHLFGGTTLSQPADVWVGLSTTTPTDAGTNFTEPAVGAYARVQVPNESADGNWSASSSGTKSNAVAIEFPKATASWGTITHFGIFDAVSSGNLLAWGALTSSQAVDTDNILKFPIGDLDITLD